MRHGLICWSREEVPASVLENRVSRLQGAIREAGLGAVLLYTSFARPSAVAWLTHFVPYWNEALLLVFPTGSPVLLAAFSKRVHDWIREVSHVGEVRSAPDLGRAAAAYLKDHPPALSPIGVLELDALPWSVAQPMVEHGYGDRLVDASSLFAANRQPADAAEIQLARRAAEIAVRGLEAVPASAKSASRLLAAVEAAARLEGAEEVLARVACDLGKSATLCRIEGAAPLGARHAVELAIAYKAVWVRFVRCRSAGKPPRSWQNAARWLAENLTHLDEARVASGLATSLPQAPGRVASWTIEACVGSEPLSVVASDRHVFGRKLPPGTLASVSVRLDLEDGPWLGGRPVMLGEGQAADFLA